MDELKAAMNVDGSEWEWLKWMFTEGLNGEAPLIHYRHMPSQKYTYFLTASGTAATIDYLELKEAQRSGSRATLIAFIAIAISIIVGAAQIYFDAFY
ncbi:MAG TPA: hypothetical protein VEB18_02090 [Candidatus Paceibacterota bacterium]|nr:hypothetical protein [Candidatus Paceibacterota bacterium]